MLRLLLLVLLAATAYAAEEAVPTHLKVKAKFTRLDKDGKQEVYAEPTVITVDGKQTTITVGSAEEGVVFTFTPRLNKDGTLTLETISEYRKPPTAEASSVSATPTAPSPRAKSKMPFFHGVLTKDKLFSIEDSTGKRQWVPLGRRIDGWTLKSYDEKREALTLSRLGQSVELVLHKAVIVDVPTPRVVVTLTETVTTKPGVSETFGLNTARGVISLEAEILDVTK
jgi:type II secretory pathway component GspD/PulD (secretin)